jgi:hypothetical protein
MEDLCLVLFITAIFCYIAHLTIKDNLKVYYDPILVKLENDILQIYPPYRDLNVTILGANDSFTENKKKMFICLKNKAGEYYDYNTLIYITLHELSHVLTSSYKDSHGKEFTNIFQYLLQSAKDKNIFDDQIPIKYDYCGIDQVMKK